MSGKAEKLTTIIAITMGAIFALCITINLFFTVDLFKSAKTTEYEITAVVSEKKYIAECDEWRLTASGNDLYLHHIPEKFLITIKYENYVNTVDNQAIYLIDEGGEIPVMLKVTTSKNGKVIFYSMKPK